MLKIAKLSLLQLDGFYNALDTRIQNWNNDKWHHFAMTFEEMSLFAFHKLASPSRPENVTNDTVRSLTQKINVIIRPVGTLTKNKNVTI